MLQVVRIQQEEEYFERTNSRTVVLEGEERENAKSRVKEEITKIRQSLDSNNTEQKR